MLTDDGLLAQVGPATFGTQRPTDRPVVNTLYEVVLATSGLTVDELADERARNLTRYRLRQILVRDGAFCFYCQHPLSIGGAVPGTLTATFDHVIPDSAGGRPTMENGRAACGPCNVARGDLRQGQRRIKGHVDCVYLSHEAGSRCVICEKEITKQTRQRHRVRGFACSCADNRRRYRPHADARDGEA